MHLTAAKRLLWYLKGIATISLNDGQAETLVGYRDADYSGDLETSRSTTGFLFTLNGEAVSWGSKRQATITHSTTEEEHVAAAVVAKEAVWLRRLILDTRGRKPHARCAATARAPWL